MTGASPPGKSPPDKTTPDFGRSADAYARYRQGFKPEFYEELATYGVGLPGQRIVDIGTGTGLVARALARRGCEVTALDPSEQMLAAAMSEAAAEGQDIAYMQSRAEETGLPEQAYDVIIAANCWHWFDRPAAAAESMRLLRSGGRLVIAHQEWLVQPGNVLEMTLGTVRRYADLPADREWTFRYPEWLMELHEAGFKGFHLFGHPVDRRYSHEGWVGRMVASAYIGPRLGKEGVQAFRDDLQTQLAKGFPDPMVVPHRVFVVVLDRP